MAYSIMQILNMCSTAQDVPIDGPLFPCPLSVYELRGSRAVSWS